ncbi:MAG: hypothetical protein BA861_06150 [Desulfobacterales bacterium S3730MH5]|nr:MAG: hypothetical protein BA861_06150 [Desulfobacterales bacterium S3730MH5]
MTLFIAHIPAQRFKERVNKFLPYLRFIVCRFFVDVKIIPEPLGEFLDLRLCLFFRFVFRHHIKNGTPCFIIFTVEPLQTFPRTYPASKKRLPDENTL